jgi:RNA polymerase sigma-70 factor (ECF subfamily)
LNNAIAGDLDGAFEPFVLAFQDRIYRFALRFAGNREDAEEIAQDAFVRAYRALQTYPAERRRELNLRPWLYTITLNVARNRVRRKQIVSQSIESPTPDAEGPLEIEETAADGQPATVTERRETGNELATAIAALPARYRAPVILRHIEGMSYAEVASTLDQPIGTAKANVHRGIRMLRETLESTGLAAAGRTSKPGA